MRESIINPPRPLLLLVDDDPQIRLLLSEIGAREGFEVLRGVRALYRLIDKYAPRPGGE